MACKNVWHNQNLCCSKKIPFKFEYPVGAKR